MKPRPPTLPATVLPGQLTRWVLWVFLAAGLTGCQAHKITLLRVETPLGVPVPGADIEIGTTYSGHPEPAPHFALDAAGSRTFPDGMWINSGSYVVLHIGGNTVYFTRDTFHFESGRTLILRLSQAQMQLLEEETTSAATPFSTDSGLPSQDLRFQLPEVD